MDFNLFPVSESNFLLHMKKSFFEFSKLKPNLRGFNVYHGIYIKRITTRMGFEPTRAEHIGLAVQRLNHSATSSTSDIFSTETSYSNTFRRVTWSHLPLVYFQRYTSFLYNIYKRLSYYLFNRIYLLLL